MSQIVTCTVILSLSTCLQVTEMYSSGGELHLELLTGQPQGSKTLWVGDTRSLVPRISGGQRAWEWGYRTWEWGYRTWRCLVVESCQRSSNWSADCWMSLSNQIFNLTWSRRDGRGTVAVNKKFTYRTSSAYVLRTDSGPYWGRTLCVLLLRTNRLAPRDSTLTVRTAGVSTVISGKRERAQATL